MSLPATLLGWAFLGIPAATLLPWGIGLGAATVTLYLLRLRRRPVLVPFVDLWTQKLGERSASRLRSQLRRLLSLLVQLLLLGLLLLALADPRPDTFAEPEESWVLLIDTSASMSAEAAPATTRLARAIVRAKEELSQRGPRDEVLLVELSARPAPVGAWTRSTSELERALDSLTIKDESADLPAALRLAAEALLDRPAPRVLLLSDGALPPLDLAPPGKRQRELDRLEFVSVAAPGEAESRANVGISAFSARRYPLDSGRFEVLLEVANSGATPAEVEVTFSRPNNGSGPDEVVEVLRLTVPAEARKGEVISDLDQIEEGIVGQVRRVDGGENWLPRDDEARALLERRPHLRVLVVGPPNTFLDAALLTRPGLQVERVRTEDYPPRAESDVVIFDQTFPPRAESTGAALYLGAPGPGSTEHTPLGFGAELSLFGFDSWQKQHRIFRFIDPYDVQVLSGRALQPRPADQVLGRSGQSPILVSGIRPEGAFVALGFDPGQSDFVLRAAFPLFIENVIEFLAQGRLGEEGEGLKSGESSRLKAPGTDSLAVFEGPLGHPESQALRLPISGGEVTVHPSLAGFYRLTAGQSSLLVTANPWDDQEVSLSPSQTLRLTDGELAARAPRWAGAAPSASRPTTLAQRLSDLPQRHSPWVLILLAVCGISLVEWWTYHRRITV